MGRPQKERPALPPGIVGSVDELAAAIGVHRRTVQEWKAKHDFPSWSNGRYNIVKVDRWRHGYNFIENDNPSSLLDDMDHRTQALIESLKSLQSGLVQKLSEAHQDDYASILDEAIGGAVKDAYSEGDSDYFYTDFYKGEST
ncbi:helix-turn-helix domain-containing protein [Gimesia algae]|uniref:Helix-turn-helix domain protein n=1 Tax=Gimesia algae TaxID=2527971 RepID=A0A517V820_9PLAN|nr:helix-turn-helix domain-containing protein [Gimesia algae]QDT89157.1 hypothetical protein Pan161_07830 [Gimesia algae]